MSKQQAIETIRNLIFCYPELKNQNRIVEDGYAIEYYLKGKIVEVLDIQFIGWPELA